MTEDKGGQIDLQEAKLGGIFVECPPTQLDLRDELFVSGDKFAPWLLDTSSLLRLLQSSESGLDDLEAKRRLKVYGPNRLPEKPPRSPLTLVLSHFKGFLNITLIFAAVIAGAVGDLKDALMISAVVLFNSVLGFLQEHRAEQALAALKGMLSPVARARRAGQTQAISANQLVPGDIVLLEAGERVPSDGRVMAAFGLEIDESALTGESVPVHKQDRALAEAGIPLADRSNMAFMNTVVTRGRGEILITTTGPSTEIGRLAGMLELTVAPPTPLQIQLDQLGKRLTIIAGVIVAIISVSELLRGDSLLQMALEAVTLAVAAIPEGLPAVVTVTLALGLNRMARNRAIVKQMAAVETLGCTTVICSDKTGTLTLNQMTVRALWFREFQYSVTGEGYRPEGEITRLSLAPDKGAMGSDLKSLFLPIALCNDSRIHEGSLIGDPTEGALLTLCLKGGLNFDQARLSFPRIAEVPFESERRFMVTFHEAGDHIQVFVKGAPDVLLSRSQFFLGADGRRNLSDTEATLIQDQNHRFASKGLRLLAVADRSIPRSEFKARGDLTSYVTDLTFLGIIGIMDPPRSEAKEAMRTCKDAGISVKMITGDHPSTASAIATELGISGVTLSGKELDAMNDAALIESVDQVGVFARVAPEHKLRIVRALKSKGHVVAMTGDGVNDAPALKSADIGVAMGSGTEVAKEAATMVLTDDNFATIVGAVKEGRTIYDNIVKFVRYQLSTNIGALSTVFLAPILGLPSPLTPIQILWVAMIMDGPPALALGLEPARPAIMKEAPRKPSAQILSWERLKLLIFYGAVMAAGALGILFHGVRQASESYASTLAFTTFVLFQFFNVFNARSEGRSAFGRHFFANARLWMAIGVVVALQILVIHWKPLQSLFGTTELRLSDWALSTAVAGSLLLSDEIRKAISRPKLEASAEP